MTTTALPAEAHSAKAGADTATTSAKASDRRANTAFHAVMETAPMGLLISAALGLIIVGIFQYIFYLGVLPAGWSVILRSTLSTGLAAFFEGLGFYFLVATVRDFSAGHRREGYIGLLATCLLWVYAIWEAHHISAAFDAGGKYWAIMGIIGTIVCVVRVVELRITLTVTSAYQKADALAQAETTIEDYRKQLLDLSGKVNRYEAEMKAAEDRKNAEEQRLRDLEAAEAERRKQEEVESIRRELAAARRELAKVENGTTGKVKVSSEKVSAAIRDFMRKNRGMRPTRAQIAAAVQVDERSLRNHFPNGSLDATIAEIFAEINQSQPEITI